MEKISDLIIRFKWQVITSVFLITLFFIYQLFHIKVDSNIINSLPVDDPDVSLFREVGEKFGSNEIGMVIIKADNVLMPQVLDDIQIITDTLSNTKGIVSVTSLTNLQHLEVTGDDFQVTNLINKLNHPKNIKEADALMKKISSDPMITGNLIAKNGTSSVIIFSFDGNTKIQETSKMIMEKIDGLPLENKHYFAGAPFMVAYVSKVVSHDLAILIPISFLIITLLLYFSFHSAKGVVLPLLTAGLAIIWGMGLFTLLGFKLSMVSNNVPIIILAIGTAYVIHILNQLAHQNSLDKITNLKKTLSLMMVPVSLSALTTMVGFLSFIFGAYLTMIRDFGILAAMGTFFSGLLAITFVPALIAVLPEKKKDQQNTSTKKQPVLLRKFLIPLSEKVIDHPQKILTIWIIIFIISLGGIFMLKRSVSVAGYFKDSHPVSISEQILSESYGGTKPLFITFTGNILSPEVLKAMMDLENYMKESPLIGSTQSVADIVRELNRKIGRENKIPDDEASIGQLWFLLDQQESISRLISPDQDQALIIAKFQDIGDNSTIELTNYMKSYFDSHQSENYTIQMTGMPFINKKLSDNLLYSQIVSLIIAIILVMTIVSLMLRSFVRGIYASLPVIVTIGIVYGIMGFSGIPLNIATVLVASIAMGIGIDYSIHFFSYFNHIKANGGTVTDAINESIRVSGKAIIINFISVALGFLTLIFSNLVPMIYFGIIIALSMLGAAMGALTLLPSILLLEQKRNH
ncbi:MAG: MMPL family transporter [Flavobacteriaceae bacterium]|nr:MMPL family transporter [Flavobacteriaceae bacterium]